MYFNSLGEAGVVITVEIGVDGVFLTVFLTLMIVSGCEIIRGAGKGAGKGRRNVKGTGVGRQT